jgi:hypothetical protein
MTLAGDNLYVSDAGSSTIRKIAIATGAVSTPIGIAGRAGVQPGPLPASLSCPAFLATIDVNDIAIVDACENAVLIAHDP